MNNGASPALDFRNDRKAFQKSLIALVLPIALQNLISAAVSMTDVLVLSAVSQTAMSAVSLAGQITFFLSLFYFGLTTGAGILTAQYWGKKDVRAIEHVLSIACAFSTAVSLAFFAVSFFAPNSLMLIFTPDMELVFLGAKYLKAVSFSYLFMGLSQIYLSVLKSMENARLSACFSSGSLILDLLLSALCVFVLFYGMPEKAVLAIGITTSFARFVELMCCYIHAKTKSPVRFSLPAKSDAAKYLLKDFLKYTMPVQGNFLVWGGALTASAAIIGHVSSDMVAANAIASVVKNLAVVLCVGIAGGGSVLVGKYLGNNDRDKAKRAGDRTVLYAMLFGIAAGLFVLLIKPMVFLTVNLTPASKDSLNDMLYICAFYCIGKSLNSTIIGGIFCAGGDSKFGFLCDTVVMWGIVLPLSYVCAFVLQVPPVLLYAVINLDEFIKLPIALMRYKKYTWLNNITRELS
ncbi:MAG TPA: MATE family efflux transporter [Clostridia bacterium]|nr:MATE family efflux transporter [Clostridia bacterium]